VQVLKEQTPWLSDEAATAMAGVAASVRQQFESGQGLFWLSTADLVMWATISKHIDPYSAAEISVLGKAPATELDFVRGRVRLAFDPDGKNLV
jgi:hypothetical protein